MKAYGWAGLALLIMSECFLFARVEPFYSWFYSLAWWSYILLADNLLLKMRGRSLLTSRRRELPAMLASSVFVWLLFEACNLVLKNWGYEGLPRQLWIRWPGYALAFATVFPGIFITADLVEAVVFGRRGKPAASEAERADAEPTGRPSRFFLVLGVFLTTAPLAWPRAFFPTVWIGPIFLFDPLLEAFGVRSLSQSAATGRRCRAWSLLLGGLVCGLLWEFWNYWAGSKWIYTVPYFANWRLFEMPVGGFLGFPPFALECWILYHVLREIRRRLRDGAVLLWLMIAALSVLIIHEIDSHTVVRYAAELVRS
jgi:hypothetical protein